MKTNIGFYARYAKNILNLYIPCLNYYYLFSKFIKYIPIMSPPSLLPLRISVRCSESGRIIPFSVLYICSDDSRLGPRRGLFCKRVQSKMSCQKAVNNFKLSLDNQMLDTSLLSLLPSISIKLISSLLLIFK